MTILVTLLLATSCTTAPPPPAPLITNDVHTLQLRYLDAAEAARVLQEIFDLFATADLRTNTVIFRGTKPQRDVADGLVQELD